MWKALTNESFASMMEDFSEGKFDEDAFFASLISIDDSSTEAVADIFVERGWVSLSFFVFTCFSNVFFIT